MLRDLHKVQGEIPADWPHCPQCNKPLNTYCSRENKNERFSLETRTIFGWCQNCNKSIEILQFFQGVWQTSGFKFYRRIGKKTICYKWHDVAELPVPAVVTGPAEEFDKAICLNS
jgi:hypothetical protein